MSSSEVRGGEEPQVTGEVRTLHGAFLSRAF